MTVNRGGEVDERIELLQLARAGHGQQACDGEFPLRAAIPKHDLAPLDGGAQGAFRDVVRRRHTLLVHEREEMLVVHEQRAGQIADVGVGGIDVALPKRKELLLDRERLGRSMSRG